MIIENDTYEEVDEDNKTEANNKKTKKKKNNFFENETREINLIKNKSKGDFKYNLFLKKQKNNSEKKEISKKRK